MSWSKEKTKPEEANKGIISRLVERLWRVAMVSSFVCILRSIFLSSFRNATKIWMAPDEAIGSLFALQDDRINKAATVGSINEMFWH